MASKIIGLFIGAILATLLRGYIVMLVLGMLSDLWGFTAPGYGQSVAIAVFIGLFRDGDEIKVDK